MTQNLKGVAGAGHQCDSDEDCIHKVAEPSHCSDERPCIPCFTDKGPCLHTPPQRLDGNVWIELSSGVCPTHPDAIVEIKIRGGETNSDLAKHFDWGRIEGDENSRDIVAYRVLREGGAA